MSTKSTAKIAISPMDDVSDITVHTFGFGYSLDDEVLDGLASEAGGIFAFVPDAGMVGTTFTNLSASLRATAASDVRLNDLPLGDLRHLLDQLFLLMRACMHAGNSS